MAADFKRSLGSSHLHPARRLAPVMWAPGCGCQVLCSQRKTLDHETASQHGDVAAPVKVGKQQILANDPGCPTICLFLELCTGNAHDMAQQWSAQHWRCCGTCKEQEPPFRRCSLGERSAAPQFRKRGTAAGL